MPQCDTGPELIQCITDRWKTLVDTGVTSSEFYTTYKGKPLVSIWGLGFNHIKHEDGTPVLNPIYAKQLIAWFHTQAPIRYRASVLGGVPTHWRTLQGDSYSDPSWSELYETLDVLSPWSVGRYTELNSLTHHIENVVEPDKQLASSREQSYLPVIFPGFSWKNLQETRGTTESGIANQIPREGGQFLWDQARLLHQIGINSTYVAIFDEVDEATAIFKTVSRREDTPINQFFLTLDADGYDLPSDWYLQATKYISEVFRGQKSSTDDKFPLLEALQGSSIEGECGIVEADTTLAINAVYRSCNGEYSLVMQSDGNLVVYQNGGEPVWDTMTDNNPSARGIFQGDGNLVIYSADSEPIWHSGSHGYPNSTLRILDSGQLGIYWKGQEIWRSQ